MRRVARIVSNLILTLLIAIVTAWASLALWYRLPAQESMRGLAGGLFILIGVSTIVALFSRLRRPALVCFIAAFGAVLVWWTTIRPEDRADWAPDVARQVTGTLDGDKLTLTNVRDFEWRSDSDFTERWTSRTYDLTKLRTLDLFMSYWAGPEMAHTIMSFGFEGGDLSRLVDRGSSSQRRRIFTHRRSIQEQPPRDHCCGRTRCRPPSDEHTPRRRSALSPQGASTKGSSAPS